MRRTKEQKGITLIALIITIVVLLILAVVAINSIQNDGIMSHAGNTANTYNQAVKNEQQHLDNYLSYLDKVQDEVNGGSKTYKVYGVGDTVTVVVDGVEHNFYVIKDDGEAAETVLLLAKQNIIADKDNANYLTQSSSANSIAFSTESYWGEGTSPYDIVEPETIPDTHTVAKAAYDYGVKVGGAGRLMTYKEADDLSKTDFSTKLYEIHFWLGTAGAKDFVYSANCNNNTLSLNGYIFTSGGVRPVIEISKSKLS